MSDLIAQLRADPATVGWIEHLEALDPAPFGVALPPAYELPAVLLDLAVPHEDVDEVVAAAKAARRNPAVWWLIERSAVALAQEMGQIDEVAPIPAPPAVLGELQRFFAVVLFVALLPHTQAYHHARGIPDNISRLTLADLGRNMALYRRKRGHGGLDDVSWIRLHFRGALYALGRLQFERATLGNRTGRAVRAAGLPFGPGDPALSVHIPASYGPLTPEACDRSFAQARTFFARHFAEESYAVATCHSWLLDEQLAEYLPPGSNILAFARRFHSAYRPDDADAATLEFVFRRSDPVLDELPRRTALERAVVDHLRAGRHWHGGAGWLLIRE